ncbi:MAG: ATP-dependent Clp protease adapter ClpS [Acidimicrobiia bacterium]|nr:ATP-dependent Clp protease adapter ClpS [Acidimicrobiia bacterium]
MSARNVFGSTPSPTRVDSPDVSSDVAPDLPWNVIVWNDPVNLMTYVVWVFRKLFGFSEQRATELMLDVHHRGRATVASGPREQAEVHATRLHQHGLWATLERQ